MIELENIDGVGPKTKELLNKLKINDGEDLPHKGFGVFREIMDRYHPKYFLHGHVHKSYTSKFKRYDEYQGTIIVNACEKCIIDVE